LGRLLKVISWTVACLFLVLLGTVLAVQWVDWNRHRDVVAGWVSSVLHRSVLIEERFAIQLFPEVKLDVAGLRIGNPEGDYQADFLTISEVSMALDLTALLSGLVRIREVRVDRPVLHLQRSDTGHPNWRFRSAALPREPGLFRVITEHVSVTQAELNFQPRNEKYRQRLTIADLEYQLPVSGGSGRFRLLGELNGTPMTLDGTLGSAEQFAVGALNPVDITLRAGTTSAAVRGSVKNLFENRSLALDIEASGEHFGSSVGLFFPDLEPSIDALFAGPIQATGHLVGWPGRGLRIERLQSVLSAPETRMKAEGAIELDPADLRKGGSMAKIRLRADTPSIRELVALFGPQLPIDANASATGELVGGVGNFGVEQLALDVNGEVLELTSTGRISSLGARTGPQLDLQFKAESSALESALEKFGLRVPLEGAAIARGKLTGVRGSYALEGLSIVFRGRHIALKTSGQITQLGRGGPDLNLRIEATSENVQPIVEGLGYSMPFDVPARGQGVLAGTPGKFRFDELKLQIDTELLTAHATGEVLNLGKNGPELDLAFDLESVRVQALAEQLGYSLPIDGRAAARGVLLGKLGQLRLRAESLSLKGDLISFDASGEIWLPGAASTSTRLEFNAATEDTEALLAMLGHRVPVIHAGRGRGILVGSSGAYSVKELQLSAEGPGLTVSANGAVTRAGRDPEFDLSVSAVADNVEEIVRKLDLDLDLETFAGLQISAATNLHRSDGQLLVETITGALSGPGLQGSFSGNMHMPRAPTLASVTLSVTVDDLNRWAPWLPGASPDALPAEFELSLVGSDDRTLPYVFLGSVTSGQVDARLNGKVSALSSDAALDAVINVNARSVSELGRLMGRELSEPTAATVRLVRNEGLDQPLAVDLQMGMNGLHAKLSAEVPLPPKAGFPIQTALRSESLADLSQIGLPSSLPATGPLNFSASITPTANGIQLDDILLTVMGSGAAQSDRPSDLRGSLTYRPAQGPQQPVRISGDLQSDHFDLTLLTESAETLDNQKSSQQAKADREPGTLIFSDSPLPLKWIRQADITIDYAAENLIIPYLSIEDVQVHLLVDQDQLQVETRSGRVAAGDFTLKLELDGRSEEFESLLDLKIDGLQVDQLPGLKDQSLNMKARIDMDIELAGGGPSLRRILSGANGHAFLGITEGRLPVTGLKILTGSLFRELLQAMNPLKKKKEFQELECGSVGFRIVDGVAISRGSIVIQTPEVWHEIRGGVRLRDEAVLLALMPHPRKGIGVSAASVFNPLRLGGTLRHPVTEVDEQGLFKSLVLGIGSGGVISVIEGLTYRFIKGKGGCERAKEAYALLLEEPPETLKGSIKFRIPSSTTGKKKPQTDR